MGFEAVVLVFGAVVLVFAAAALALAAVASAHGAAALVPAAVVLVSRAVVLIFGAVVVVLPIIAVIAAILWVTIVYLTKVPTFGSLTAAALFVGLPHLDPHPMELHLFTLSIACLILVRHGKNLTVLRARKAREKARQKNKSGR